MATGVERIAAERQRQVEEEQFDPDHDRRHVVGELAWAAVCYAAPEQIYRQLKPAFGNKEPVYVKFADPWPWQVEKYNGRSRAVRVNHWDKRGKHSLLRRLEIAGALIAAEIDRLQAEGKV